MDEDKDVRQVGAWAIGQIDVPVRQGVSELHTVQPYTIRPLELVPDRASVNVHVFGSLPSSPLVSASTRPAARNLIAANRLRELAVLAKRLPITTVS